MYFLCVSGVGQFIEYRVTYLTSISFGVARANTHTNDPI